MASEFDLIERYFKRPVDPALLGGGDDCALLSVTPGRRLAVSKDLLLEGRHFFSDVDPYLLGHKALAVNLSDLAAMGAKPVACMLGLGLPAESDAWLKAFAEGFYSLVDRYQCPLIGGDTTRSQRDIVLSVTVFGEVDDTHALRRSTAKIDDDIWISGQLGAADLACRMLSGELALQADWLTLTREALEQPIPRVELGLALLGFAHSAIDVSDGLLQDLGHILTQSRVGALIDESLLPLHPVMQQLPLAARRQATLAGGDLYELVFTAAVSARATIEQISQTLNLRLTRIGKIVEHTGLTVLDALGNEVTGLPDSYDHFKGSA